MIRAIWFLIKLSVVIYAVAWLAQRPGSVEIVWQDYIIQTSVGIMLASLLVITLVTAFAYRMWRAFVTMPKSLRQYRNNSAKEKGYLAVTRGLVAIASGDNGAAAKQARKAKALLPDTSLTKLLSAQSSLMNGDTANANLEFTELLEDKNAAFFGIRGLLNQSMQDGDNAQSLKLIRKAEALQPKRDWVIQTLFDMETRNKDWDRSEITLAKLMRMSLLDREIGRHYRQAILLARSDDAYLKGIPHAAITFAKKSFSLDNGFIPAAIRLARLQDESNKRRASVRTIEKAWSKNPHPTLVEVWNILAPIKKSSTVEAELLAEYEWIARLAKNSPNHIESNKILGRAALKCGKWEIARENMRLAEDYIGLAKLEREQNDDEARAREWMELAVENNSKQAWVCQECSSFAKDWSSLCYACGVFGKYQWLNIDDHISNQNMIASNYNREFISPPNVG